MNDKLNNPTTIFDITRKDNIEVLYGSNTKQLLTKNQSNVISLAAILGGQMQSELIA